MLQQCVFQTIVISVWLLAGLSKSYPVGRRELILNGPNSSEIIEKHIYGRPGKDNKAFESYPVEQSQLTPVASEPREMFYKDIRRKPVENGQVGTNYMYYGGPDRFNENGNMVIKSTYRKMKDIDEDIKVGSSDISFVEGRKFVQYRPEPREITRERETDDTEGNVDTERCPNEMYGVKCTMPCPVNCQGNCNRSTGYCSGCKDKGHYGNLCEMICVQCNNLSCYFFDGTCIEGDNATYVNLISSTDRPMKNIDNKIKVGSSDISSFKGRKFVQYRPEPVEITRADTIKRPRVDIEDDHDPLDQWYFNINVRAFNRISTYLFRNFTSNSFLIFLMSALIIVAIVGMYVLCKHSPGAI